MENIQPTDRKRNFSSEALVQNDIKIFSKWNTSDIIESVVIFQKPEITAKKLCSRKKHPAEMEET